MSKENSSIGLTYQWKKGEKFGSQIEVTKEDKEFLYFDNGEKMFKKVVDEFLNIVDGDNPAMPIDLTNPPTHNEEDLSADPTVEPVYENKKTKTQNNILLDLIDKSNKKVTSVKLNVSLELPQKSLLKLLYQSYKKDDVNDALNIYLNDKLDYDTVVDAVRNTLDGTVTKEKEKATK